jgi:hypothetical protein
MSAFRRLTFAGEAGMSCPESLKCFFQSWKWRKSGHGDHRLQRGSGQPRAGLPARIDSFEELIANYRPEERIRGLCRRRVLGWIIAARCLGVVPQIMLFLVLACLFLGPLTCFLSWEWAFMLLVWGTPVFAIIFLVQSTALGAIGLSFRWQRQGCAIAAARTITLTGLLLSLGCVALAVYYGIGVQLLPRF